MNLIEMFQDLVGQVPEIVQPLIVALAGAVPFVEGEGATTIGILGGLNPVVAVAAAAIGNFLCVFVLVTLSSGARSAIVNRNHARANEVVLTTGGSRANSASDETFRGLEDDYATSDRKAARAVKFQRALAKYGVPGVSLLGPLLLPTQFTSTMLAAAGVRKARVLFWQAIAILAWSILFGVVVGNVIHNAG